MSEQSTNTAPQPSTPEMTDHRQLSARDMDDLRNEQKDYYIDNVMWASPDEVDTKTQEANEAYQQMINDRLDQAGISEDHPQRAEYVALLSEYSIGNTPDSRWDIGKADDYGIREKSNRELFGEKLNELNAVSNPVDEPDAPDQQDTSDTDTEPDADIEKLKQISAEVETVRKRFAELLAERSKRFFESSKTAAQIDAAYEELSDLISATATEMMDALEATGSSAEAISTAISEFISMQIDAATSEMEAARAADYLNRGKWTKKALDKWASWGGKGNEKFFSKERFKGNLKKSAVFAIPGAIVAGVAAPLVGAVAGTAAVGIGAGYASRKIARSVAGAKLDNAANAETIARAQATDIKSRMDAASEQGAVHSDLLAIMKDRSEVYRKRNRNRLIGGIAISSAAGILGSVAGDAIAESITNHDIGWKAGEVGRAGNWIQDKFDGNNTPEQDSTGGGHTPSEHQPTKPTEHLPIKPTVETHLSTNQLFDGNRGTTEFTQAGQASFNKWVEGRTVKSGDTIWKLSGQYLQSQGVNNPNVYQIDAVKDSVLKQFQAKGIVGSRGWLNKGDIIKLK